MFQGFVWKIVSEVLKDKDVVRKLVQYSSRDLWFVVAIFVLVFTAVNLAAQLSIAKQQLDSIPVCPIQDIVETPPTVTETTCRAGSATPSRPTPAPPVPKKPVEHVIIPPDRRDHDVRRLLNDIE